jgi:DNA-binding MarR family transcriptional regulator
MTEAIPPEVDPYGFIFENIESVPQLEALMLLWNSRPVGWTLEELSSRLYVPAESVEALLRDLVRLNLIAKVEGAPVKYRYLAGAEQQDRLMAEVDLQYRRDLVRISTMIHSKASAAVREFSRAFRFKKERE